MGKKLPPAQVHRVDREPAWQCGLRPPRECHCPVWSGTSRTLSAPGSVAVSMARSSRPYTAALTALTPHFQEVDSADVEAAYGGLVSEGTLPPGDLWAEPR